MYWPMAMKIASGRTAVSTKLSTGDIVFWISFVNVAPESYRRCVSVGSSIAPVV